jgi:SAM-dependent methyltransferase
MPPDSCRLCSSTQLCLHFEVRGSVLDRCEACGFVQVREQPSADELRALYGVAYFERGKYDEEFAQQREGRRRLELLAQAGVRPGGRVLEAGCATGDFLALASERYEMWGLDVSAHATDAARAKNPDAAGRIFTGFVEEQTFAPDFFDAIVMWDVVEHLWDPKAVLRRLVRHLRPGGGLLLSTPDIGAATARLLGRRWAFMTPPEHLGFFNQQSLRFLLEGELGLEITRSTARGKWANVGFLVYKLRRVFPDIIPRRLSERVQKSAIATGAVYVPTADVRYVLARKREG